MFPLPHFDLMRVSYSMVLHLDTRVHRLCYDIWTLMEILSILGLFSHGYKIFNLQLKDIHPLVHA